MLQRRLELGAGFEAHAFAGLDLDLFAGARVAAHARGAMTHSESAEAGETEFLAFLEFLGNRVGNRVDGFAGLRSAHAAFLQRVDKNLLAHWVVPFPSLRRAAAMGTALLAKSVCVVVEPLMHPAAGRGLRLAPGRDANQGLRGAWTDRRVAAKMRCQDRCRPTAESFRSCPVIDHA